ncbi:MAG: 5-(carboxyamino)imidazole ribonucleotide synthase [Euzebya sp.]
MTTVLGIVGGGQLARMIALDAVRLGVDVRVLAGAADEGVRGLVSIVDGEHDDPSALRRLAEQVDVVTFDHELVPLDAVRQLEAAGVVVRPGSAALEFADKVYQRTAFAEAGLPVPPFAQVTTAAQIQAFAAAHGWPVILKAPRGGYDGRGVAIARTPAQAQDMLTAAAGRGLLVEPLLSLSAELAVLVVTSGTGERATYAPVQSIQVEGMCKEIRAGATAVSQEIAQQAVALGQRVADVVGAVGVLAVELFIVERPDGEPTLLVNEIAPRPHNSGHHTIDGCVTSQFENHARAVLGWPLGSIAPLAPASVMVNVVGGTAGDPRDRVSKVAPDVKIHLYDKTPRPGRKIGHVTVIGDDLATAAISARAAATILEGHQ